MEKKDSCSRPHFKWELRLGLVWFGLDKRNFHFNEHPITQVENRTKREQTQTHNFVLVSKVVGRGEDKDNIVKLLLSFVGRQDLSVIPIIGLGGIGKTTLVKLVYHDDRVIQSFELRIWVSVSEDFKLNRVIEQIIISVTCASNDRLDVDQLQTRLRDILYAKKFLLVLDNVWDVDPIDWSELRDLLTSCGNGSAIIVTTRDETTALNMGTILPYNLSNLPYDDCLSLFMRHVFEEGHGKLNQKLVEVGKEIVNKCGGVPLVVKALACLLRTKTDVREWLNIKDNDIWELEQKEGRIILALRLSFQQLPSYLKQCFAYCSIFPKDYKITKEELINHWMAQGFLQSDDGRRQLEDIGNQYFNELMSRSFFDEVDEFFDSEIIWCKMHDIVHDLAQLVAGAEWLNVDFNSKTVCERVRHISFTEYDFSKKEFPKSLLTAKKLRTFSFSLGVGPISKSSVELLILHFRCLRVLDLTLSEFEELPSFVGNLKHLRYLSLPGNRNLKALPNSICKLLNLQTLYFPGCEKLQDLPRDIGKLVRLRHLDLTSQQTCLPVKGLQGLTSLQSLWLCQCYNLESLSEGFQYLISLRRLDIQECPNLASLPSGMKYLTALEKLRILDCEKLNLLEGEDLQGLKSLRSLSIIGLPKLVVLPPGLQHSAATLQYLYFRNCQGLKTLPEWLQSLTSLQRLYIENCRNLLSLPEGMPHLTSLQQLFIKRCLNLSKRCRKETGEDWPKISHIPEVFEDSDDEDFAQ